MFDLAAGLAELPAVRGRAPWRGYEYVKGWGVFGLPFDSGHVLALRVFPEGDFGAYRTIWHCDSGGEWSIYVDGPRLETACPRYYAAACASTGFARIELGWTGPASLRIVMDSPSLVWTLTASETATLRVANAIGARLPLVTWRPRTLLRARERLAQLLGMGELQRSGRMPSGHRGVLMPQRMYFVDESTATLDGASLGRPTRVEPNPTIGSVPLPARGVLAIGQAMWEILDSAEYERTRKATLAAQRRKPTRPDQDSWRSRSAAGGRWTDPGRGKRPGSLAEVSSWFRVREQSACRPRPRARAWGAS